MEKQAVALTLDDFTYEQYIRFLQALQENGYRFLSFSQAAGEAEDGEPFVLLRHDIDFSLEKALLMSEIEAVSAVRSTYFFLLSSSFYNLFSRTGSRIVRDILRRGHRLGLHFDCAAYEAEGLDVDGVRTRCLREASALENWFGEKVDAVSFHRPQPFVLSGNPQLTHPLPHSYMAEFVQRIKYLADSRGQWRYGQPGAAEEFLQRKPMHILVHPIWWTERKEESLGKLLRFIEEDRAELQRQLAANCMVYRIDAAAPGREGPRGRRGRPPAAGDGRGR